MDDASGTTPGGLAGLRVLFLSFCGAIVAIGVAGVVVSAGGEQRSVALPGLLVFAAAALSYGLGRVLPGPLDCADLAASYRNRFFLRLACHESAALVAFAAVVLTRHPELYLIGAASTALGFARTAPTSANLDRDQEELRYGGCTASLREALG